MNDRLLRALRREPLDRPPIWFMRQAGRYLPEYRAVRATAPDFLAFCRDPEKAAEVTLQPLRRFRLDASIVFNDILIPPAAMGMELVFDEGHGPRFPKPLVEPSDLALLREVDVQRDMPHVLRTIGILHQQLEVPLFGFAGAPFTLAAYMIEGGGSREFLKVKRFALTWPQAFEALLERLAGVVNAYLRAQVAAGCAAVQLFDTWAGELDHDGFHRFALPYARKAIEGIPAPRLYYVKGGGPFLKSLPASGADGIALDWRVDIAEARAVLGDIPVMGNLDPVALFAPPDVVRQKVRDIVKKAGDTGYIFNLGHGILPGTPIEGVEAMVSAVVDG